MSKTFTKVIQPKIHVRIQSCQLCNKSLNTVSILEAHKRIHTVEKHAGAIHLINHLLNIVVLKNAHESSYWEEATQVPDLLQFIYYIDQSEYTHENSYW